MAYSGGTPFRTKCVITPTTDAVTANQPFKSAGYQSVVVAADNLAGAEEVDLFMKVGASWVAVPNADGDAPQTLTATNPMVELAGGPYYSVKKDATVGACGVFVVRQTIKGV